MNTFFSHSKPVNKVTHGKATFDLPILYHRDDAFALYFTANYEMECRLMEGDSDILDMRVERKGFYLTSRDSAVRDGHRKGGKSDGRPLG